MFSLRSCHLLHNKLVSWWPLALPGGMVSQWLLALPGGMVSWWPLALPGPEENLSPACESWLGLL